MFAVPRLNASTALLIKPCSAVHTFGMQYAIDVAFLDVSGVVIRIVHLKPGSVSVCREAEFVIEMLAGTAERLDLTINQHLYVKEIGTASSTEEDKVSRQVALEKRQCTDSIYANREPQ